VEKIQATTDAGSDLDAALRSVRRIHRKSMLFTHALFELA
jgi:hypothetical protein